MLNRAYSILEIKGIDEGRRRIHGVATSPSPDRAGDIIEPLGAVFPPEMPLLLHHRKETPVGIARFKTPTKAGIEFEAELPIIEEPGAVRDEVNRAWVSIQHKLIRGVSIGFRVIGDAVEELKSGGVRFLKTEILELSLVTVPANADATLAVIKQLDLAASGHHSPGVTGLPVVRARKDAPAMTIPEQITQFENTRAAKVGARDAIMAKSAEAGTTLDTDQGDEYDSLDVEVKSIDVHLSRLRDLEKSNIAAATPIKPTTDATKASDMRGGHVVQVKSNAEKGSAFIRYAMAVAAGKGDHAKTVKFAKAWTDMPEVELLVHNADLMEKASVYPGTIADATWAGPLAPLQNLTNEFLELLRPATLLGRIPNMRRVPFNVSVPIQTAGGTYGWVGEGAPKPVTNLQLGTVTLGIAKVAGIIVLTEELVKLSSPSAEATVRNDMIAGIAQYLDTQFVDPAVAAVTNVSPASITNGTVAVTSAGTSGANALTDLKALYATFIAANLTTANAVFLMSEANAFALSTAQNALSQPLFPGVNSSGGALFGRPVITSQALGNNIVLVDAQGILYADDGGVTLDVSREASVEMNTAPTSPVVAGTILVSLWQQNLVGLRAERFINWKRARLASVKYVVQAYV